MKHATDRHSCAHTSPDTEGAARAGVINLTKTLAVEWASSGIRINAVAPGVIYSETAAANYPDPHFLTASGTVLPARRLGTAEEVSASVVFLASPLASYITGINLTVDGGGRLSGNAWTISDHASMAPFAGDPGLPPPPGYPMPYAMMAAADQQHVLPPPSSKL